MRFLDRQGLVTDFLSKLSNKKINESELILWSYSPKEKSSWTLLNKAREKEFGEIIRRGSEPDIIVKTDKVLYFIEAKLNANNKSKPSNPKNRKQYETGGNNMFRQIFRSDYETVVIKDRRYELMRFWLLGNWIAHQLKVDFEFYNLVPSSREKDIESGFGKHIIQTEKSKFFRLTWEKIYDYIRVLEDDIEKQKIIEYFENKTIGYNNRGNIIKAFDIAK